MSGTDAGLVLSRLLFDAAALFLWGAGVYLGVLVPEALRGTIWRALAPARSVAFAALVVSIVLTLPLRTMALDEEWANAPNVEMLLAVATGTNIGTAWLVQAALVSVGGVAWIMWPRLQPAITTMIAGLLLASLSITGHAAMNEGWLGRAHQVNNIIHLLAAGAWIGALPAVLLILPRIGRGGGDQDAGLALMRFSTAGHLAVTIVVLSGIANMFLILGKLPDDWTSQYQRLLVIKIALVLVMIAIAVANRYVFVPRMRRQPGSMRALAAGTIGEIAAGLAVLGLVAWFGMMEPGA